MQIKSRRCSRCDAQRYRRHATSVRRSAVSVTRPRRTICSAASEDFSDSTRRGNSDLDREPAHGLCARRRRLARTHRAHSAHEIDHDHEAIVKLNPLAEWTEEEVWDYIRENDVPVHPLYARGYTSIGCAPCTRAIAPGEPARAGRWWWETNAPKECGMHCAIETGGFEHELHAILGDEAHA